MNLVKSAGGPKNIINSGGVPLVHQPEPTFHVVKLKPEPQIITQIPEGRAASASIISHSVHMSIRLSVHSAQQKH